MSGGLVLWLALALAPSCVLVADPGPAVELRLAVGEPYPGLAQLELSIEDSRLVPCSEARASLFRPLVVRVARAHHVGSREGLDGPRVVSLLGDSLVGGLETDVGRYCALEVFVTPSPTLAGNALTASGRLEGEPFAAEGYAMMRWLLPLESPVEVAQDVEPPAIVLSLDVQGAVRDGLVMGDGDAETVGVEMLLSLKRTAGASVAR